MFGDRHQSQFPKRRQTVTRYAGPSEPKDHLSGIKPVLEQLKAAQAKRDRARDRAKPRPAKPKGRGRGFRTLILLAAVLYGFSYLSDHFDDLSDSLGNLEKLISGNGDELVEKLMAEVAAKRSSESTSPVPGNQLPPAGRGESNPATPGPQRARGPVTRVSELPHYSGAETEYEDATVAIYATDDPVSQVADTTFQLLEDRGWHGSVTAESQQMRHLTFTRGHQEVTAYISVAPGLGNRTSIQYQMVSR